MDKIIKKLFCWVLGHNFHKKDNGLECVRCGVKAPDSNFIGDIQINQWEDIEDATTDN